MDIKCLEDSNVNKLLKMKNLILMTILFAAVFSGLATNCLATDPPSAGLVVWFKADTGVTEDAGGVLTWDDQSGNSNHANRIIGDPQLATAVFPNGSHDVIQSNGDDALRLTDAAATQLTDFNIFMVISCDEGSTGNRIFGNYSVGDLFTTQYGYAVGATDTGAPLFWYFGSGLSQLFSGNGP